MKNQLALACALSLTLVAPALATAKTTSGKQPDPRQVPDPKLPGLLPGMHGEGGGTWRAATKSAGRLRATATVDAKGPTFGIDCAITRVARKGSSEIGGELLGEMLLIDPREGSHVVALIAGEWSQEDGRGAFVAHILVPTGDKDEPYAAVGRCFGPFDVGAKAKGSVTVRFDVTN